MLGGIVQHIAQHLLQPLRVTGDRPLKHLAGIRIFQVDAVLAEKLPVGVDGVLHLSLEIHLLHPKREAAIFYLGKLQQLLHHVGESAGLPENDPHTPVQLPDVAAVVSQ